MCGLLYDMSMNYVPMIKNFTLNIKEIINCCNYMAETLKFLPCINNFTKTINHSKIFIDHIFTKSIKSNKDFSNILWCSITDHYATILVVSNIINNESIIHNKLILNKIDINHLDMLIKTENLYSCLNFDNVDNKVDIFNSKIK